MSMSLFCFSGEFGIIILVLLLPYYRTELVLHGDKDEASQSHRKVSLADRDCDVHPWQRPLNTSAPFGSLHDVVGQDGVLMISMDRDASRFDTSAKRLAAAGIFPSKFRASDGLCDSQQQLQQGCYAHDDPETMGKCAGGKWMGEKSASDKSGYGCTTTEQAITDSHRRALEAALERDSDWTAIFEEDVVPVRPLRWDRAFKAAWASVPEDIKIVRLSYCMFPNAQLEFAESVLIDVGDFKLTRWNWMPSNMYSPSGCTGGYVVHRDIIPEILGIFPCCCAIDCCLEWDFFNKNLTVDHTLSRGMQVLLSMDAHGSTDYANDFMPYPLHQNGVLVQDCRVVQSIRWREESGQNMSPVSQEGTKLENSVAEPVDIEKSNGPIEATSDVPKFPPQEDSPGDSGDSFGPVAKWLMEHFGLSPSLFERGDDQASEPSSGVSQHSDPNENVNAEHFGPKSSLLAHGNVWQGVEQHPGTGQREQMHLRSIQFERRRQMILQVMGSWMKGVSSEREHRIGN
jgi:hypothetical protein